MGQDLAGKVAVVTGGANGIGLATARRLAESGARVALWDRVAAAGLAAQDTLTREGLEVLFVETDVTDASRVAAAVAVTVDRFGGIDILVNNAGITRDAQLVKVREGVVTGGMAPADFDAVVAVNLRGVYLCTQAVVPVMLARGGGRILNASSVVAHNGNFGQTNYAATKAGVIAMTQVWARELGKRGITVNAVAPGWIATGSQMPTEAEAGRKTPVGRSGTAAEVAAVIPAQQQQGEQFTGDDDRQQLGALPWLEPRAQEGDPGEDR